MKTIAITGCNRGLGLSLANHLLNKGHTVIGMNRTPSNIKHQEYREVQYSADLNDLEVEALFTIVGKIDVLILNAGMFLEHSVASIGKLSMEEMMRVNAIAPVVLAREFLCVADEGSTVIVMGSRAEDFTMKSAPLYSASKAALRAMFKELEFYFKVNEVGLSYLSLPRVDSDNSFSTEDLIGYIDEAMNHKGRIEFRSITN